MTKNRPNYILQVLQVEGNMDKITVFSVDGKITEYLHPRLKAKKEAETAILNAVKYLRTQPDCKTAADKLMRKLATEKLRSDGVTISAKSFRKGVGR